jgi:hypothetical protein
VAACGFALTHGLTAAYPLGIQKNDAGLLLALAFLITVVAPDSAGLRARLVNPLRLIVVLGLLSTQSRGPMLAVIAVLAMQQFRSHRSRRGFVIVVAAAVAMGGVTLAVTEGQLHRAQVNPTSAKFFGIGAREATYKQALSLWSTHRLLGAGLRYFRDPTLATSEPHDVVIETLAESGVVGLLALSVLLMQAALALRRVPGELATLARYALVVQFIAGSFDIYWVAGRGSFPWVLVGMALGAHAVVTPSAAPSRVPGAA